MFISYAVASHEMLCLYIQRYISKCTVFQQDAPSIPSVQQTAAAAKSRVDGGRGTGQEQHSVSNSSTTNIFSPINVNLKLGNIYAPHVVVVGVILFHCEQFNFNNRIRIINPSFVCKYTQH